MIEHIISIIAPHKCVGCNHEISLLCHPCQDLLRTNTERCKKCKNNIRHNGCTCYTGLSRMFAVTHYTPLAKQLIAKLKFERAKAAAKPMARLMTPSVPAEATVVCHIPTATNRVRMRGYDQAKSIARLVAQYSNKPHATLLARTSNVRQVGSSAVRRRTQLHGAFRPVALPLIKGAHVVLIDDVLTTGSSAQEAAQVLLSAGAARVDVLVFALADSLQAAS